MGRIAPRKAGRERNPIEGIEIAGAERPDIQHLLSRKFAGHPRYLDLRRMHKFGMGRQSSPGWVKSIPSVLGDNRR
jgi:hypothetical protein